MPEDNTNVAERLHVETPSAADLPPAWKCTDSYRYPLPPAEGDPWMKTLKPRMDADKAKCGAWTDEVQNLLLFAGLFSAVVTGFAVDSYKGLQEDPVVVLLAQIAAASNTSAQTNGTSSSPVDFAPSSSTIRLNIFLFMSLIMSLATALIGIVALQWLREHRHDDESFTPETSFAILHMRTEALKRWRVPQIFAALPLLLQTALILFLAAMVELLVNLGHNVIVPVGVVIGFTVLFLVLTTILPTLQTFVLYRTSCGSNSNVPVPCPYKSPQSRAFRRLITSSNFGFLLVSTVFTAFYSFLRHSVAMILRLISAAALSSTQGLLMPLFARLILWGRSLSNTLLVTIHKYRESALCSTHNRYSLMQPQLDLHLSCKTWHDVDLSWMSIRDNYFQANQPETSWLFEHRATHIYHAGLYDLTMGMYSEMLAESFSIDAQFHPPNLTDYHCMSSLAFPAAIQELDSTLKDSIIRRNQFLAAIFQHNSKSYSPLRLIAQSYETETLDVIRDENVFMTLHFFEYRLRELGMPVPSAVYKALAEVYHRMLGYLYSCPREMVASGPVSNILVPFDAKLLWVMDIYGDLNQPFTFQWAKTLHIFFNALMQSNYSYDTLSCSFHAHPFIRELFYYFWSQLDWELRNSKMPPESESVRQAVETLAFINRSLEEPATPTTRITAFQFYNAATYIQFYWRFPALCTFEPLTDVVHGLIPALQRKLRQVDSTKFEHSIEYPDPLMLCGGGQMVPGGMEIFSGDWWRILLRPPTSAGM